MKYAIIALLAIFATSLFFHIIFAVGLLTIFGLAAYAIHYLFKSNETAKAGD